MENFVVIVIIAIAAVSGALFTIKHFKGKGGCCGGSGYRPKKKKLSAVRYQKTFKVEGMHCNHCKMRVEEAVNGIKGIAGKADFKKGELTVSYAENVDDSVIVSKVERAGYKMIQS